MSDTLVFDVAIIAFATLVSGMLSYYDVPKKRHKLIPEETRASRAVSDAYAYAVMISAIIAGSHIGDARHAPYLGLLAGGLVGGLFAIATRDRLGRMLAARTGR